MKKAIFVFAIFTVICALAFSERTWLFESGARDLDGKGFARISVVNKTGRKIDVSGEPLENNGKGLYFEDSILISGNCDDCEAFYSIDEGDERHLQVAICRRGTFEPDSETHILPPMRISRRNPPPPPPRHHMRREPAPERMKPHHPPRHHEPHGRHESRIQPRWRDALEVGFSARQSAPAAFRKYARIFAS